MRGSIQKTCECCGQVFECGGYKCWCGKVGITESHMDWIAARYEDCLCSLCLGKIVTGERGSHPVTTDGMRDKDVT
ncbi:MAG: cysteine-rich CWC family protein [Nitrospira sp.]|nr:cysteine-rich CWC family protein [Nitrospira sp.]